MPQSPESKKQRRQSPLRPLLMLGFVAVGLVRGGVLDDFAESLNIDTANAAQTSESTAVLTVETVPPVVVDAAPAPEAAPVQGLELGVAHDRWILAPNYLDIINSLDKTDEQKAFMRRAVEAIYLAIEKGALVNPRVLLNQILIETGQGTDSISGADEGNNMVGQRAWGNDPFVWAWTREYNASTGKWERMKAKFKKFNSPDESIMSYAASMAGLEHYKDAFNCRHDDDLYIGGLLDERDPTTCQVIRPQGHLDKNGNVDVLSYGTAPDYRDVIKKWVVKTRADEIFPLAS